MLALQTPGTLQQAHTKSIFQGNCQYFRLMLNETLLGSPNCQCYLWRYVYAAFAMCYICTQLCANVSANSLKSRYLTLNCSKRDRNSFKLMSWKSYWTNLCDLLSQPNCWNWKESSRKASKRSHVNCQRRGEGRVHGHVPSVTSPKGYDPFAMQMVRQGRKSLAASS